MSKEKFQCGTCTWFDKLETGVGSGFCTVNPPVVIIDRDNIGRSYRPMVDDDSHHCREWESVGEPVELESKKVTATAPKPKPIPPPPPGAAKTTAKKSK